MNKRELRSLSGVCSCKHHVHGPFHESSQAEAGQYPHNRDGFEHQTGGGDAKESLSCQIFLPERRQHCRMADTREPSRRTDSNS